ncbi:MAG: methyl-accepting chemotaxis sensory transducer, partial [Proteobacteria bacterium]|nr:methyl-accepting chemotaxis sensory transducer [Pseudomonadota bacterium]
MKLTVARKMALLAGSALFGIVLLAGVGQLQTGKVFEAANFAQVNSVPALVGLDSVSKDFLNIRILAYQHLAATDSAKYGELEESIKSLRERVAKAFKSYEDRLADSKDRELLAHEKQLWGEYQSLLDPLLAESRAHRADKVHDILVKLAPVGGKLRDAIDEHFQYNVALGQKGSDEALATKGSALNLSLLIAALTLAAVGFIAFTITRSLLRQLGGEPDAAAEVATKIAAGDLSSHIELKAGDQSSLMASMQLMSSSLQKVVGDMGTLNQAASRQDFALRGDVTVHQGDFRKIIEGANQTLDIVVDKLEWYRSIIDSVPFPIHVIDMDMKWTFLNKAFEKLMVERGYVRDRQDAVGRACSTANANICNTKNCGIMQLKSGVRESFFDWGELNCKQDTANVLNAKGETVGYVETVTDLTATLRVKNFTEKEVQRVATNLERLGSGDLNLDLTLPAADKFTQDVQNQFGKINGSLKDVGTSLTALIADTNKLSAAAAKGQFANRADATQHPGEFRKVVEGINGTLDVVVDKLEWYRSIIDAVPFPIHVIDMDMKWTFLNKAFEKLMVERGYVRDRQDAVGRACSTANANICNTKNCGIMQLKSGVKESFFDWGELNCKQDTANVLNAKGETVGYVETVSDLTSTLRVKHYTEKEVQRVAVNLERLSCGNLDLELAVPTPDQYTKDVQVQFGKIDSSFKQVGSSLKELIADASMLTEAAVALKLDVRADASKHQGDYRRVVEGVNATLDAVVNPLNTLIGDVQGLTKSVIAGELAERSDATRHRGQFREVVEGLNRLVDAIVEPLTVTADYVDKIANGVIPPPITTDYKGQYNVIKGNLNATVKMMSDLLAQTDIIIQGAANGELDKRADAGMFKGGWQQLVAGVNKTLDGIILPVNEAIGVLVEMEKGDLTQKVMGDYKGQLKDFKNTVNNTVEKLAQIISEVNATTETLASATGQISSTAQSLSQASSEQAASVEETSASVEQMSASIRQNTDNAKVA